MRLVTRLVLLIGVVLVALTAGLFQTSLAKEAIPGVVSSISVSNWDRNLSSAEIGSALLDAANAGHANIYKQGYSPDGSDRRYYSYIGNSSNSDVFLPGSKFHSFDPDLSVDFLNPRDGTALDVRGNYAIQGSASNIQIVTEALSEHGFVFSTYALSDIAVLYSALVATNIVYVLMVLAFCVVIVLIYDSLKDARSNSVRELFGYTPSQVLVRKLIKISIEFTLEVGLVTIASAAFLKVYNGFAQYGAFLSSLAVGAAVYGILVFAATALGTRLAMQMTLLDYLRGESAHRTAYRVAFAAKAVIFLLVATFLVSGVSSGRALSSSAQLWEGWQRQPDLVATSFSAAQVNMNAAEMASMQSRYRRVITDSISAAPVVVASSTGDPRAGRNDPSPDGNSLVVNSEYLRLNEVRDVSGQRVTDTDSDVTRLQLLLPERYSGQQDAVAGMYRAWLDFQQSISTNPVGAAQTEPRIDVVLIADDQTLFDYSYIDGLASSYISSPVLAVVDPRGPLLSDDYWAAAGSRGQIMFGSDPSSAVAENDLQAAVPLVYAVKDRARNTYFDQRSKDIIDITGTIIALVVAGFGAASVGALYIDANRRTLYIRRTFGWTAVERHHRLFALTVLTQLAIVAVLFVTGVLPFDALLFVLLAVAIMVEAATASAAIAIQEAKSTPAVLQQN